VQCIKPAKTDDVRRQGWRNMPRLIRLTEHQAKRWGQGSEFGGEYEHQIDLQSVRQEKYALNPRARLHVKMMQGQVLIVHAECPVGKDLW